MYVISPAQTLFSSFGELCWFFFAACGVSAYMLGVNPFDQPGVEAYKKNMFALLGKPGFAEKKAELDAAPAKLDAYIVK